MISQDPECQGGIAMHMAAAPFYRDPQTLNMVNIDDRDQVKRTPIQVKAQGDQCNLSGMPSSIPAQNSGYVNYFLFTENILDPFNFLIVASG